MPVRRNTLGVLAVISAASALAACGGSQAPRSAQRHRTRPPSVCDPQARAAMARSLKVAAATITTAKSTGNNNMPQCTFTARVSADHVIHVLVNADSSPQPYQVLERTIQEASQIFGSARVSPAPINVPALGLAASWFPSSQWLKATDGVRLITASVDWARSREQQDVELARAMIRPYLATLTRKQIEAIVKDGSIP